MCLVYRDTRLRCLVVQDSGFEGFEVLAFGFGAESPSGA